MPAIASANSEAKERAMERLCGLLALQQEVAEVFGDSAYNIFVFGSYLTTRYVDGESDIDIAVYTEDFELYKRLAVYLEDYFIKKGVASDIFYIDITMDAPIYCAPLKSKVQFTDYYPEKLVQFYERCRHKLQETKARMAG